MIDQSLTAKIDSAIAKQTKYITDIDERISRIDDRLIDYRVHKNAPRKSEREKIRRKKKIRGRNSRRSSARAVERHSLSVYSGTIWLGSIEQVGDKFIAKTTKGRKIPVFGSLTAAADAVSAIAEAA